jgi:hypothetical protein
VEIAQMTVTKTFRRKRLFLRPAIAASVMVATATAARAEPLKDPYAVDILGFHLGMVPDEVKKVAPEKLKSPDFRVNQGSLSLNNYRSPEQSVFGVEVSEGRDTFTYQKNQERIYFVFDQRPPYKARYIRRERWFDQETAPSIRKFMADIQEKYGPASGSEDNGKLLIWTYGSDIKAPAGSSIGKPSHACLWEGIFPNGSFALSLYQGQFSSNPNEAFASCGTWMMMRVQALSEDHDLVGVLDMAIGDVKALRESDMFTFDALRKAAADDAAKRINTKEQRKSPL